MGMRLHHDGGDGETARTRLLSTWSGMSWVSEYRRRAGKNGGPQIRSGCAFAPPSRYPHMPPRFRRSVHSVLSQDSHFHDHIAFGNEQRLTSDAKLLQSPAGGVFTGFVRALIFAASSGRLARLSTGRTSATGFVGSFIRCSSLLGVPSLLLFAVAPGKLASSFFALSGRAPRMSLSDGIFGGRVRPGCPRRSERRTGTKWCGW